MNPSIDLPLNIYIRRINVFKHDCKLMCLRRLYDLMIWRLLFNSRYEIEEIMKLKIEKNHDKNYMLFEKERG